MKIGELDLLSTLGVTFPFPEFIFYLSLRNRVHESRRVRDRTSLVRSGCSGRVSKGEYPWDLPKEQGTPRLPFLPVDSYQPLNPVEN